MSKAEQILAALGGDANVLDLEPCITRLRVEVENPSLVDERGRSLVVRCRVQGMAKVQSVVIKLNTGDDARGFTDWASLMFLSELPEAAGVAVQVIVGPEADTLASEIEDLR